MEQSATAGQRHDHEPWNKGKLVGQKLPLKLKDIWAVRIRLHIANRVRDLALFDLAIDSKLRACDLVRLRVRDVAHGDRVAARAIVMQQKTQRPVQFEITQQTREVKWLSRPRCRLAGDGRDHPNRWSLTGQHPPQSQVAETGHSIGRLPGNGHSAACQSG
jgi:integrase